MVTTEQARTPASRRAETPAGDPQRSTADVASYLSERGLFQAAAVIRAAPPTVARRPSARDRAELFPQRRALDICGSSVLRRAPATAAAHENTRSTRFEAYWRD